MHQTLFPYNQNNRALCAAYSFAGREYACLSSAAVLIMEEADVIATILTIITEETAARKEEKIRQAAMATLQVALTSLKGPTSDAAPTTPSSMKGMNSKASRRSISVSRSDSSGGMGSCARNRRPSLAPETASNKDKKDKSKIPDASPGKLSMKKDPLPRSVSGESIKQKIITVASKAMVNDCEDKQADSKATIKDAMKAPSGEFKPYLHARSGADYISNPMKKSAQVMLEIETEQSMEKSNSIDISSSKSSDSEKKSIAQLEPVEKATANGNREVSSKGKGTFNTPGKLKYRLLNNNSSEGGTLTDKTSVTDAVEDISVSKDADKAQPTTSAALSSTSSITSTTNEKPENSPFPVKFTNTTASNSSQQPPPSFSASKIAISSRVSSISNRYLSNISNKPEAVANLSPTLTSINNRGMKGEPVSISIEASASSLSAAPMDTTTTVEEEVYPYITENIIEFIPTTVFSPEPTSPPPKISNEDTTVELTTLPDYIDTFLSASSSTNSLCTESTDNTRKRIIFEVRRPETNRSKVNRRANRLSQPYMPHIERENHPPSQPLTPGSPAQKAFSYEIIDFEHRIANSKAILRELSPQS